MLVTGLTNVRYLTGFTGDSSYLLLTPTEADTVLVSDPRYEEQLAQQCEGLHTFMRQPSELLVPVVCQQLQARSLRVLKIEGAHVAVDMYQQLKSALDCEIVIGGGEVEQLRAVKDSQEIKLIQRAVTIAQKAFESSKAKLRGDQTERQVAFELENTIRELGGEGCSFAPIVAVGPQSALPHAEPGDRRIDSASFVLVDWGATVEGYRSDLTRVLKTSKTPAKFERMVETVSAAQQAAISAMRPGVAVTEVDQAARAIFAEARMSKRFNHGLGHGIGLDIHETPFMRTGNHETLQAGMVVTVEPGVYYPGFGGVRIEDDVLITEDGAISLSNLPTSTEQNTAELC